MDRSPTATSLVVDGDEVRRRRRARDRATARSGEIEASIGRTTRVRADRRASSSGSSTTRSSTSARRRPRPPADRLDAAATLDDRLRGSSRAPRGPRPRLPRRPRARCGRYIREYRPVLDRRRRRRRRAPRDRPEARRHHRRLRLGVRAGAALRRRPRRTTCTPTAARPGRESLLERGVPYERVRASRAPARTSRCCSRTRPARS